MSKAVFQAFPSTPQAPGITDPFPTSGKDSFCLVCRCHHVITPTSPRSHRTTDKMMQSEQNKTAPTSAQPKPNESITAKMTGRKCLAFKKPWRPVNLIEFYRDGSWERCVSQGKNRGVIGLQ